MKAFRIGFVIMAATLITLGLGGTALAFHDGGVASCDGCHTMHNSYDGAPDPDITAVSGPLLKGSDPSSVCLGCHSGNNSFDPNAGETGAGGYHIKSTDGSSYTPGGDFYWMSKTWTWTAHGHSSSSEGDDHGHNVVAADFGMLADATLTVAPGGTYNAGSLGCNSCHDPHGKKAAGGVIERSGSFDAALEGTNTVYGNYRLLGDTGYTPPGGSAFTSDVPVAITFGNSDGGEADNNHADYGANMSEFCRNCHGGFSGSLKHPAGNDEELSQQAGGSQAIYLNYNQYVKTGDMGGQQSTAYLALVPFERGTTDRNSLDPTSTVGPGGTANVMCLTCHRAHATAFQNATRWDMTTEFPVTDSHPNGTDDGSIALDKTNSYYGSDMVAQFGEYQRSFCNKCHPQD